MKYQKIPRYKYKLTEDERYHVGFYESIQTEYITLKDGDLTVRTGYRWDGPSGPTLDTPSFMKGSLIHDALYQLMREGALSRTYRKKADKILRKMCLNAGMFRFRAWYVYQAVRLSGAKHVKQQPEPEIFEV